MGRVVQATRKDMADKRYQGSRMMFVMILFVSFMNIWLYYLGAEKVYAVSAAIPYFAVVLGCIPGMLPMDSLGLIFAAAYFIICLLCWYRSKKSAGWLVAGCVIYALDVIPLMYLAVDAGISVFAMCAAGHVLMLLSMTVGIVASYRQVNVPEEFAGTPEDAPVREAPLRMADMDVKFRILLEDEYGGHKVIYRRVKRTNELVIDGWVYDEIEMLMEFGHSLSARINGQIYEVGYDAASHSYFSVDGVMQCRKLRWY